MPSSAPSEETGTSVSSGRTGHDDLIPARFAWPCFGGLIVCEGRLRKTDGSQRTG